MAAGANGRHAPRPDASTEFAPVFSTPTARCLTLRRRWRAALAALWRDKRLQYTWLRALQGRYVDFWQVTGDALDFALDSADLRSAALRTQPQLPALLIPRR